MIGYTLALVEKNKAADGKMVGVKIGRACIKKGISVKEVAKVAGVSTVTVYAWFMGDFNPKPEIAAKLTRFIDKQ